MTWVLIIAGSWLAVAVAAALLIGRAVHTADVLEHTEPSADHAQEPPDETAPPMVGSVVPRSREVLAEH